MSMNQISTCYIFAVVHFFPKMMIQVNKCAFISKRMPNTMIYSNATISQIVFLSLPKPHFFKLCGHLTPFTGHNDAIFSLVLFYFSWVTTHHHALLFACNVNTFLHKWIFWAVWSWWSCFLRNGVVSCVYITAICSILSVHNSQYLSRICATMSSSNFSWLVCTYCVTECHKSLHFTVAAETVGALTL